MPILSLSSCSHHLFRIILSAGLDPKHTRGNNDQHCHTQTPTPYPRLSPISPAPRPRTSFNLSLNLTRNPTTIKVPRLRLHLLPIHKAIPGPGIQRDISLYRLEPFRRGFITPRSIPDNLSIVIRGLEVPIRSAAFPFAEGGVRGGVEREGEGCTGDVVCWENSVQDNGNSL